MAVETGKFTHTLEQIDDAVTEVTNAKGQSASLSDAITAAAESVVSGLDVTEVGGSGKYISAIKEVDGKISATPTNLATAPASGGTEAISSGAVYTPLETLANNGAKNLLKYRRADNTLNDVTFTNNSDGSISLSGTSSAAFARQGTCLLSDLPTSMIGKRVRLTGTYSSDIRLRVFANASTSTASYTDDGNGVDFTVTAEMISNPYQIRISIANGTNCTGVTIYPMLRDASLVGDMYQPYAPTNRELYEMILDLQQNSNRSAAQLQITPPDLSEPDLGENGDEMR